MLELRKLANNGETGSRTWKSIGPNIVSKLAVLRVEELHRNVGATSFPLCFVQQVVDKCSEHDYTIVWIKSFGEHVGTLCKRPVICQWAGLAFRVRFHDVICEVRNPSIDLDL